uniref:Uncharacterized protein n=1 Tax=Magallana gigas TaxID=29159 RepID=A0A8W8NUH5_MAGGI
MPLQDTRTVHRNKLAALDHNGHLARETKINKDGSVRCIVRRKLDDEEGNSGNIVLEADDPRRISKTLVRIPPLPIAQLVKERKSRFEDPDNTLDNSWDS